MDILSEIVDEFKSEESIKAIVLGGSCASQYNDSDSDYDLYIYSDKPVNVTKRRQIAEKFAQKFEVDNNFFENGDEWILKNSQKGIDIMYRSPDWIEGQIKRIWEDYGASVGYSTCFIYNVKNSKILYDTAGWYKNLQDKVSGEYPEQLRKNIIAKNLPLLYGKMAATFADQIILAVKRGDINSVNHRISAFLASYFDVIFAINKQLHPGEKRLIRFAKENCNILPENFEKNIENLITSTEKEKYLNEIIKELKKEVIMTGNTTALSQNLGISATFTGIDFDKYSSKVSEFVNEFSSRANKKGQFLNWVNLPQEQIKRVDEIYSLAEKLKNQTGAEKLSVLGIGGSKHTVEHMLSINGLNVNQDKILFYSDVDSASLERYLYRLGDITKSNYLIASKSGSTFETKDGFLRVQTMLENEYKAKGHSNYEELAAKHFIAVTDGNAEKSELRRTSNEKGWLGDLYIHDDVGGRFSAFDDHALFTLAYAGMAKSDMIQMLEAAQEISSRALTADLDKNIALKEGIFWANATLNGILTSVHQYMGSIFENTVYWHAQMQNESVKNTLKQVAKVPDAMHHSAEAHFNPANKFAFALTTPKDHGVCRENAESYIQALEKSYESMGAFFNESVETKGMGLTPEAAGAMTQLRAYATVYQEIVEKIMQNIDFPEVLDSVLQPHVEYYKKNLKGGVVVPGRISE